MALILVIDDDEQVQAGLRGILEEAGYMVVVASNGRQGLQQFRREPADLVLLDIFMPELDGLETLVELHREYPAAKVIAISGGGKEPDFSYFECARMFGPAVPYPNPLIVSNCCWPLGTCYEGFHRIPTVASVIVRANKSLTRVGGPSVRTKCV